MTRRLATVIILSVPSVAGADLLSAFLAQRECSVGPRKARAVVVEARRAELVEDLPEGLLLAVVLAESGGLKLVARGRGRGKLGVDAGEAQIHVANAHKHGRRLRQLLTLQTNLAEGARLLAASRARCRRAVPPAACRRSEWALYNAGSKRWWPRVEQIWRRLMQSAQWGEA